MIAELVAIEDQVADHGDHDQPDELGIDRPEQLAGQRALEALAREERLAVVLG